MGNSYQEAIMFWRVCFRIAALLAALAGISPQPVAWAQTYPTKPIRMIVGFPPGGAADIIARILGQKLGERFQQQLVIDNRAGAGGSMASEITAKAAPDGYTLLMISSSHAANAALQEKLPYQPVRDFAAVILVATAPNVLIANPAISLNNVAEVIAMARARPGQLNFASAGNGSITHLAGELFKRMANVNLTHVPYKGSAPALVDVISGQVQLGFCALPTAVPQIKNGRVKAIAVTSAKRSPMWAKIPTISESGIAGYEASNWYGILAPAATPRQIVGTLNAEVLQAIRVSDISDAIARQGADPAGSTPVDFENYMKSEIAKWTSVVRDAGLRGD
jgi:tripartite-type tricarboxylate transporter receptor subunit TctC